MLCDFHLNKKRKKFGDREVLLSLKQQRNRTKAMQKSLTTKTAKITMLDDNSQYLLITIS